MSQKKEKISTPVYSYEKIDEILKADPPVYSSGIYFSAMAKRFGVNEQVVKNKCVKLGLIKIHKGR